MKRFRNYIVLGLMTLVIGFALIFGNNGLQVNAQENPFTQCSHDYSELVTDEQSS